MATFRKHGDDAPVVLGVNAVIATTTTRIRAGVALTGSAPDSTAPAAVLQPQRAVGLPLPPHLLMDQAGGWGKTRAQVDVLSEGQTSDGSLGANQRQERPHRYTMTDFVVDPERIPCICPNGVVSTKAYQHGKGDGVFFRFLASHCTGCPLWASAVTPRQPEGPSERLQLGLPQLPAGRLRLQPDPDGADPAGRTLAGRTDDCHSGMLSGLSADATGGPGDGPVPAVPGLRQAQPLAVAEPGPAGVVPRPGA